MVNRQKYFWKIKMKWVSIINPWLFCETNTYLLTYLQELFFCCLISVIHLLQKSTTAWLFWISCKPCRGIIFAFNCISRLPYYFLTSVTLFPYYFVISVTLSPLPLCYLGYRDFATSVTCCYLVTLLTCLLLCYPFTSVTLLFALLLC